MSFNLLNTPKAYAVSVTNGSNYGSTTTFPGTAISLIIDASQTTGTVGVRLNGDSGCTFNVYAGSVVGFSNGDVQATSIAFANSTGSTQAVQVIAGIVKP